MLVKILQPHQSALIPYHVRLIILSIKTQDIYSSTNIAWHIMGCVSMTLLYIPVYLYNRGGQMTRATFACDYLLLAGELMTNKTEKTGCSLRTWHATNDFPLPRYPLSLSNNFYFIFFFKFYFIILRVVSSIPSLYYNISLYLYLIRASSTSIPTRVIHDTN